MVIRQVKEKQWEQVQQQIYACGKAVPPIPVTDLSLSCGGMEYILRVQPTRKRKLAVLQAIGISPDTAAPGGKRYELIKDGLMLSALPEIILYQGGSVCSA